MQIISIRTLLLISMPLFAVACSDSDAPQKDITKAEVMNISEDEMIDAMINTKDDSHLQNLMHETAQAKRYAEQYGFVWSTTDSLIEQGYQAAEAGKESEAKSFFQEAKMQFKLSIKQAKYAAKHWQELVPEE